MPRSELTLIGDCNRCGLCCVGLHGFTCQFLLPMDDLGKPGATACQVYDTRYDGMPILLFSPDKSQFMIGHCSKDSAEETDGIVARGIGHGCSLTIKEDVPCES